MLPKDPSREEVRNFFLGRVLADDRLKRYINDLGIESLSYEVDYIANQILLKTKNELSEFYNPQSEVILLSKLMYEIGYLKLQKPLQVQVDVKSGGYIYIQKYQRFTDGISLFMLESDVSISAGETKALIATLGTRRVLYETVSLGTLFYKIPLKTTYRKLYDFIVKKDNQTLEYSQAFIDPNADISLELDIDGNLYAIVKLGNTNGADIKIGDILAIEIFETTPSDTIPDNLAMIGDFDTTCTNIVKYRNYEQYMTYDEMQYIIKYNKNINNSLVYNEDYYGFILAKVRGISALKIWHQYDEDLENGVLACNINKIFCSYIDDETVPRTTIDNNIRSKIQDTVYGRYVELKAPDIQKPLLSIKITNNTKSSIPKVKQDELIREIVGYYDDKTRILTQSIIYKKIVKLFEDRDIDIDLTLTKQRALNATFYNLKEENIILDVVERGYM
ncbi:MAG: hypothetical protein ACWGHH_06465 [Sulfurovaceae bacterium]